MKNRTIATTGRAAKRPGTHDFSACNVSGAAVGGDVDPLIGIDHFHMRVPYFAPHPHAGFSAVTYLFEDGETDLVNRDSLGHELLARPGSVIWTVCGSGVLHEEFPRHRGKLAHGLQVFVNLAAAEKMQSPRVLFVDGPDVPVRELPGARVRVLVGSSGEVRARIEPPGDITFLDVRLAPGASFEQALPRELNALVYVVEGAVLAADEGRRLGVGEAARLAADGDAVSLRAPESGARVVLFAGRPLRERVVSHGPFVMNDERQIEAAMQRYRAGAMGHLEHKEFA